MVCTTTLVHIRLDFFFNWVRNTGIFRDIAALWNPDFESPPPPYHPSQKVVCVHSQPRIDTTTHHS